MALHFLLDGSLHTLYLRKQYLKHQQKLLICKQKQTKYTVNLFLGEQPTIKQNIFYIF